MINDSTNIEIITDENSYPNRTYFWEADVGKIEGQGKEITYIAPGIKGIAIVSVRVMDNESIIYERDFSILIYKQFVMLKADDLIFDNSTIVSPRWWRFINYIKSKRINAGIGIIGTSLVKGNSSFFSLLQQLHHSPNFEIWNHGYTHVLNGIDEKSEVFHEFRNRSYKYQKRHLLITQDLAKEKLNITFHTFGAPGNQIDITTSEVIDEVDDIKVWLYGNSPSKKFVLNQLGKIEFPIHNPDHLQFSKNYDPNCEYYVYQIHPGGWDDQNFEEFKKTIDFLIKSGVSFITPHEYYKLIHRE